MGYDDTETIKTKMEHADSRCLGGMMIWSVDYDSGSGSGDTGNTSEPTFPNDVFPPPEIWRNPYPTVLCEPPCTIVIPGYTLSSMTTISWPAYTTTLISISGGNTNKVTTIVPTLINGTPTSTQMTFLTISGGSTATITTTVSIPPVTTSIINFWPVSVEPTDHPSWIFQPVPSLIPPALTLSAPPGLLPFPPTHYPGFGTGQTTTTGLGTMIWPTGPGLTFQPMPTVPFSLPINTTFPFPTMPSPTITATQIWPTSVPIPSCPSLFPWKSCSDWPTAFQNPPCPTNVPWFWCFPGITLPTAPTTTFSPSQTWPSDKPKPTCPAWMPIQFCTDFPPDVPKPKGCPAALAWIFCFDWDNHDSTSTYYPVQITFQSGEPKETCTANCGSKNCQMFGCGCGPLGLPFGPGCGSGSFDVSFPGIPCGLFGCNGGCGFFGCGVCVCDLTIPS
ncbi:hypothetical protein EJ04DRAFT_8073 [Polyplosphaeria fusca]|uniref:GH18 domain-containing protein n=1 Tax=Polyplosphaeria fusca TaxID=682080 RepID=A0A9P4R6G7_9PLEO|nr:hypothetical protein EJ04DRAFT_8073 [Polyplosphaeria fusca]